MPHRRILAAALLALPVARAARADAYAELGLDLATPEAATRAFRDAWAEGRYFRAWLLLDPALRNRFRQTLMTLRFSDAVALPARDLDGMRALTDRMGPHLAEHTLDGSASLRADDMFAIFAAMMRAAAEMGRLPFRIAADAALPEPAARAGQQEIRRRLGGPSPFLDLTLRRSPAGRWRVAAVARPGGPPLPPAWGPPGR